MAASHNTRSSADNIKTVNAQAGEDPIENLPSAASVRPQVPIPVGPKVTGGAHRQRVALKITSNSAKTLTKVLSALPKSQTTVEDVDKKIQKMQKPEAISVKMIVSKTEAHRLKKYIEERKQLKREYRAKVDLLDQQFVDEMLRPHNEQIREWKSQFLTDSDKQGVSQAVVPARNQELAVALMNKFKEFDTAQQGLVVVGMGVVTMALGCHSWPFLVWVWPRLIAFASSTEVTSVAGWLFTMVQSTAFQDFIKAWQDGQPLGPSLFSSFGPEIKSAMLAMATNFFTTYQTSSSYCKLVNQ